MAISHLCALFSLASVRDFLGWSGFPGEAPPSRAPARRELRGSRRRLGPGVASHNFTVSRMGSRQAHTPCLGHLSPHQGPFFSPSAKRRVPSPARMGQFCMEPLPLPGEPRAVPSPALWASQLSFLWLQTQLIWTTFPSVSSSQHVVTLLPRLMGLGL